MINKLKMKVPYFLLPIFASVFLSITAFSEGISINVYSGQLVRPTGSPLVYQYTMDLNNPFVNSAVSGVKQTALNVQHVSGGLSSDQQIIAMHDAVQSYLQQNLIAYQSDPAAILWRNQMIASGADLSQTAQAGVSMCMEFSAIAQEGLRQAGVDSLMLGMTITESGQAHVALAFQLSDGTPMVYNMNWQVPGMTGTEMEAFVNPSTVSPVSVKNINDQVDAIFLGKNGVQPLDPASAAGKQLGAISAAEDSALDNLALNMADKTASTVLPTASTGGATFEIYDATGNILSTDAASSITADMGLSSSMGSAQAGGVLEWASFVGETLPGIGGALEANATIIGKGILGGEAFGLAVAQAQLFSAALDADAKGQSDFGQAFLYECGSNCSSSGPTGSYGAMAQGITAYFNGSVSISAAQQGNPVANALYNPALQNGQPATFQQYGILPSYLPPCVNGAALCSAGQANSSISTMKDGTNIQKFANGDQATLVPTGATVPYTNAAGVEVKSIVYTEFDTPAGGSQQATGVWSAATGFIAAGSGNSPLLDNMSSVYVSCKPDATIDTIDASFSGVLDTVALEDGPVFEVDTSVSQSSIAAALEVDIKNIASNYIQTQNIICNSYGCSVDGSVPGPSSGGSDPNNEDPLAWANAHPFSPYTPAQLPQGPDGEVR